MLLFHRYNMVSRLCHSRKIILSWQPYQVKIKEKSLKKKMKMNAITTSKDWQAAIYHIFIFRFRYALTTRSLPEPYVLKSGILMASLSQKQ